MREKSKAAYLPHARGDEPDTDHIFPLRQLHLPHARGDEPSKYPRKTSALYICPTHVGMNRRNCASGCAAARICPTHVGMNRRYAGCGRRGGHLPHARGDEPQRTRISAQTLRDLPHARGDEPIIWIFLDIHGFICPTHVGMNRRHPAPVQGHRHLPHARGDEPSPVPEPLFL